MVSVKICGENDDSLLFIMSSTATTLSHEKSVLELILLNGEDYLHWKNEMRQFLQDDDQVT